MGGLTCLLKVLLNRPNEEINYITPAGHERLTSELDQLRRIERPEVTKIIAWAASNGDRSENADYIYGKKRLREIDRRIRFLVKRLNLARIVDPLETCSKKVQFGATVTCLFEDGQEKTFQIVGVDEINTKKGQISWRSPIGRALIGKMEGEDCEIDTPSGTQGVEILKIEYIKIGT